VADIFLSYSQKDIARAQQIAEALQAAGWDVWWDVHLAAGAGFREEIVRQLRDARRVVVLWSQASIASHFVIDEADEGRRRGVLVQTRIEDVEIPLGFRQIQCANLLAWDGDPDDPDFRSVLNGLSDAVSNTSPPAQRTNPGLPRVSSTVSQVERSYSHVDIAENTGRTVSPEHWQDLERRFRSLGNGLRATLWRNVADNTETWGVNGRSGKASRDFVVLSEMAGRSLRRSPRAWERIATETWVNDPDDLEIWLFFIRWAEGAAATGPASGTSGNFVTTEIDDVAAAAARACSECHAYELHG